MFNKTQQPIDGLLRFFLGCGKFTTSTNMVGIIAFTGNIDESIFRRALFIIQKRHPLLAVRIKDENNTHFSTENVPEIPLIIMPRQTNDQWQKVVFDELHHPLPLYTGPLVRFIYLAGAEQGEILLVFNHIISDGTSRTHLSIELFEIIQALKENRTITHETDNSLISSYDAALAQIESTVAESIAFVNNFSSAAPLTHRYTYFIPHDFSQEETRLIQNRYRMNHGSLQSALSAAVAQVIAENIRERTGEQTPTIICHHPINMRPYLKPSLKSSDVGAWVSVINNAMDIHPGENVWHLARRIKEKLYTSLEQNDHIKTLWHAKKNQNLSDYELFTGVQARHPTAAVSQLGTMHVSNFGDLQIESMRGLYNWSVLFNHEDIFTLTGMILNNRLLATFVYIYPYVNHEKARCMADNVIKKLLSD